MHHISLHHTHCIILLVAHLCSYTLDHAKLEFEVQAEQAQAKDLTNLALVSRQAPMHHTLSLTFVLT
jgi:hypothetical protein